jgi:hypothetical protein
MPRVRCRNLLAGCAAFALAGPALPASPAVPAAKGLSCEQLFAVVESAVQFRDQGYSLQQVLNGLKGGEIESKLTAEEVQVLRKSVTAVYLGNASVDEIVLTCRQARGEK